VKRAVIATSILLLAGCDESAFQRRAPAPAASAEPIVSASAPSSSAPPPPLVLGPSTAGIPREEREREVEALLAGKKRAGELEVEATDPGKEWSPGLRGMLSRPKSARIKLGEIKGEGLPAEVVKRIVRQRFGELRLCYETGLLYNPSLQGRVGVRFTIEANGDVKGVENGGSDLPDSGVVTCVLKAFRKMSFPSPEPGPAPYFVPVFFEPPE
jgi:hypothetical protein